MFRYIDHFFPGAEKSTIALEAGHWVHAERPGEFASLVDIFVAGCGEAPMRKTRL